MHTENVIILFFNYFKAMSDEGSLNWNIQHW